MYAPFYCVLRLITNMFMRKLLLFLAVTSVVLSCEKTAEDTGFQLSATNFLVFGHFYGECGGEGCVETFKLTDKQVFEDTIDDYNGQNFDFIQLNNEQFEQVKDLAAAFPNQLLNESETVFGCPDCADGGGIFIQYSVNGTVKSWRIDQDKNNVPSYLRNFIDAVNAKIALLNK